MSNNLPTTITTVKGPMTLLNFTVHPTAAVSVPLADIRCDSGTQSRLSISENAVAEYCERMTAGDEFPPLDVFFDGNEYHLADGFHRTLAAERAGIKEFQCKVHKGTVQDAIWFSIGANGKNGERRSPSDKWNCIEIALNRFPDKSQEQIAEHVGCSQQYVATVKKDVTSSSNIPTTRKDSKGRNQPTRKPRRQKLPPSTRDDAEPPRVVAHTEVMKGPQSLEDLGQPLCLNDKFYKLSPGEQLARVREEAQRLEVERLPQLRVASIRKECESEISQFRKIEAWLLAHAEVMPSEKPPAPPPSSSRIAELRAEIEVVDKSIAKLRDRESELRAELKRTILALPEGVECDACFEVFEDSSDAEPIYECECGSRFTPSQSDYGNHKCSCGKFAHKLSDMGCPECGSGELVKPAEEEAAR